jgi:hypothetical protein
LSQTILTPTRRRLLLGVLVAVGVVLVVFGNRDDRRAAAPAQGSFATCAELEGDAARACYSREVGRELAAVGGGSGPQITFAAPAGSTEVTLTSVAAAQPLLCELHLRVGVVDAQVPSWLGWTEPLVANAPSS